MFLRKLLKTPCTNGLHCDDTWGQSEFKSKLKGSRLHWFDRQKAFFHTQLLENFSWTTHCVWTWSTEPKEISSKGVPRKCLSQAIRIKDTIQLKLLLFKKRRQEKKLLLLWRNWCWRNGKISHLTWNREFLQRGRGVRERGPGLPKYRLQTVLSNLLDFEYLREVLVINFFN